MWWFEIGMYCERISFTELINTFIISYIFVCVCVFNEKIFSQQISITQYMLLTIVTKLYIRTSDLTHLKNCNFVLFLPTSLYSSSPWQQFLSQFLWVQLYFYFVRDIIGIYFSLSDLYFLNLYIKLKLTLLLLLFFFPKKLSHIWNHLLLHYEGHSHPIYRLCKSIFIN